MQYLKLEDPRQKQEELQQLFRSISEHIKNLHKKFYTDIGKLNSPSFTMLFIPIESIFSLVLSKKPELSQEAWDKSIALVSPTTLLTTLKTVSNIWKLEKQSMHARKIAEESGKMLDKFTGFVTYMQGIEKNLKQAKASYDQALKSLTSGPGNLVSKAEKIRELGVITKRDLPESIIANKED